MRAMTFSTARLTQFPVCPCLMFPLYPMYHSGFRPHSIVSHDRACTSHHIIGPLFPCMISSLTFSRSMTSPSSCHILFCLVLRTCIYSRTMCIHYIPPKTIRTLDSSTQMLIAVLASTHYLCTYQNGFRAQRPPIRSVGA